MSDMSFFREVGQTRVNELDGLIFTPTFTYDATTTIAAFMTPLENVAAALPSPRLHPLRVTPGHGVVALCTFDQREADLGSHRFVAVGIPVLLDETAPILRGLLRGMATALTIYVTHLLVDSDRAAAYYGDLCGLPVVAGQIVVATQDEARHCRVTAGGQRVWELGHLIPAAQPAGRWRLQVLGRHGSHLLRSEMVVNTRQLGRSHDRDEVCLELGDHPLAVELRNWQIGRLLELRYMPTQQTIMSGPLESFRLN